MVKKRGFTLAEVLVTLGIIGVVAALTTPTLIQNVERSKVPPKLQKAKSTFATAAEKMMAETESDTFLNAILIESNQRTFGRITNHKQKDGEGNEKTLSMWSTFLSVDGKEMGKALSNYMKISPRGEIKVEKDDDGKEKEPFAYKPFRGEGNFSMKDSAWLGYDSDDGMVFWFLNDNYKEDIDLEAVAKARMEGGNLSSSVASDYADTPSNQYIGIVWLDTNGDSKPNRVGKDLFKFALYNDGTLRPWGGRGFYRAKLKEDETAASWQNGNCDATGVNDGETCAGSIFDNGYKIIYY